MAETIEQREWRELVLSPDQRASMFIDWCALHGFGTQGWPDGAHAQFAAHVKQAEDTLRHQLAQSQADVGRLREALENIGRDHADDGYMLQKHIIHFPELERAVRHLRRQARAALAPDDAGGGAQEIPQAGDQPSLAGQGESGGLPPSLSPDTTPPPKVFSAPLRWEPINRGERLFLGNYPGYFAEIFPTGGKWRAFVERKTSITEYDTREQARAVAEAAVLALAGAGE